MIEIIIYAVLSYILVIGYYGYKNIGDADCVKDSEWIFMFLSPVFVIVIPCILLIKFIFKRGGTYRTYSDKKKKDKETSWRNRIENG